MRIVDRFNLSLPVLLLSVIPSQFFAKWIITNSGLAFGVVEQSELARFLGKASVRMTCWLLVYLAIYYLYLRFKSHRSRDKQ
ncbi:MAG: hypothetical protein AB8B87_24650 [Granulosicoccus sp.]